MSKTKENLYPEVSELIARVESTMCKAVNFETGEENAHAEGRISEADWEVCKNALITLRDCDQVL